MSTDALNRLLADVHAQLQSTPVLDAETHRLLGLVSADIERLGAGTATSRTGIESLAVRFEVDHPALAAALRQVADVLGKAGI